jgi:hypothetical protein
VIEPAAIGNHNDDVFGGVFRGATITTMRPLFICRTASADVAK